MTHVYHSNLFTQQTSSFQDGAISHIVSEENRYPAVPVKSEATKWSFLSFISRDDVKHAAISTLPFCWLAGSASTLKYVNNHCKSEGHVVTHDFVKMVSWTHYMTYYITVNLTLSIISTFHFNCMISIKSGLLIFSEAVYASPVMLNATLFTFKSASELGNSILSFWTRVLCVLYV